MSFMPKEMIIKTQVAGQDSVIIQESHIALHTFAKRGYVTLDVYSCKEFDTEVALQYFKDVFKSDDVEFKLETRGEKISFRKQFP